MSVYDTVISSRIRLARNVKGLNFPTNFKQFEHTAILRFVQKARATVESLTDCDFYFMQSIDELKRQSLIEMHLISPNLAKNPYGAVVISKDKSVSVMINEEDHLREQCIEKGFALREAYAVMSDKDNTIARSIQFAYDEELGYLTACPTNLGTGLRASVMLFLPALTISDFMPRVIRSATRLGLTVRGMYGEGSRAEGYMYQLSNEVTLGVTEEEILSQVEQVVKKVSEMELSERRRLASGERALRIKDTCLRAYGILTNCALISGEEFEKLCADLKLGVCLGYFQAQSIGWIDDLIIKMKPSNITMLSGRKLSPQERDGFRAGYIQKSIKDMLRG